MKRATLHKIMVILVALFAILFPLQIDAQKSEKAKEILDKTAKRINNASGIEATFKLTSFVGSTEQGAVSGNIQIKGKKYKLQTGDQISWFDSKNLWSYQPDIDEVNVSTPTRKELQSMNPYAFVALYKKGYNYTVQNATYNNKEMWDVKLIAQNKKADIPEIIITINKDYTPMCIRMRQDKNWSRITILRFSTNKQFTDDLFKFPKDKYPNTEIIDMR